MGFGPSDGASVCVVDHMVRCSVRREAFSAIGDNPAATDPLIANAKELDVLLQQNGWQVHGDSVSNAEQWFRGLVDGENYAPLGGTKTTSQAHCMFEAKAEQQHPTPVASTIQFSCSSPVEE